MRVDLLELRLLVFEARLRLLQSPALLLELLVGDPEFLALRRHLLGLALRLLEQVLQLAAVARRSHGDADRLADLFEQRHRLRVQLAHEADLGHRIDHFVDRHRRDDDLVRRAARQRRADGQIFAGDVAQHDRAFVRGRLSEQAVAEREPFNRSGVFGEPVAGDAVELAALAHEEGAGVDAEIIAEERQHPFAELLGSRVAEHGGSEAGAAGLQPILQRAGRRRAQDQPGDRGGQRKADDGCRQGAGDRRAEGAVHLGEAAIAHAGLRALHDVDARSRCVHVLLAAIGHHDRERRVGAVRLADGDRLLEFAELVLDVAFQRGEPRALRGVAGDQRLNRILVRDDPRRGERIRPQIFVLAGEQDSRAARSRRP